MNCHIFALSLSILFATSLGKNSRSILPLLMPNVDPKNIMEDSYLCTTLRTNTNESQYITEFQPSVLYPDTIHHIMIIGCESAKYKEEHTVWSCGDMPADNCDRGYSQTIYSWSRNAPTFTLPKRVGFQIGGNTRVKYLILHVHYFHVDEIKQPDNSGFLLKIISKSIGHKIKNAGILSLESEAAKSKRAVVPKNSTMYFENACPWTESMVLHPFAMRPNTNGRGVVVSGWLIRKWLLSHLVSWSLLGRYSPNPNQAFYNLKKHDKTLTIEKNDWLAMRCTMHNPTDHDIYFGPNDSEETCNLYIMYYIDDDQEVLDNYCFSFGPPYYTWSTDPNLPGGRVPNWVDKTASLQRFDN